MALTSSTIAVLPAAPRKARRCAGQLPQFRRTSQKVPKGEVRAEYVRFLNVGEGSVAETEYLLMLSRDLRFLKSEAFDALLKEVSDIARMP